MPLVQVQQGEPFMHCSGSAFLLSETLNTELRSRWQRLRSAAGGSAAGGGRSKQGLAQRSAFCENTSRKRREPQEEAWHGSRCRWFKSNRGSHSSTAQAELFCCPKRLMLSIEVGDKGWETPPVDKLSKKKVVLFKFRLTQAHYNAIILYKD